MNYPTQTAAANASLQGQKVQGPSLLADSANVFGSLVELRERLVKLGDHLLGTEPREASAGKEPEPITAVHRNILRAQQIVQECFEALARIEARQ